MLFRVQFPSLPRLIGLCWVKGINLQGSLLVPVSQDPTTRRQSDSPSLKTPLLSLRTASFGWLSDGVSRAHKRAMPRTGGMVSSARLGELWVLAGPGEEQWEKSGNRLGKLLEMKGSQIFRAG